MQVLTLNCGGASLKVHLAAADADAPPGQPAPALVSGGVSHIGADSTLTLSGVAVTDERVDVADHRQAAGLLLGRLADHGLLEEVEAVGHRVVHGGWRFIEPTVVDDDVLAAIDGAGGLAPLHNASAAQAIRASREQVGPKVPQVAVFDTAFHHDLPERAARYPIPRDLAERHHVRRFGFHGLAHRWMSERYVVGAGARPTADRLVTLQLGNGCSAAAIVGGRPIDTSMGLTPLEGLMMSTRSGDVDPSLVGFLARAEGVDVEQVEAWLNHDSGLLGVSGRSRSMRVLLPAAAHDADAALAVDMFCYRIRKIIGAYAAALGGLDGVVFGGGIGENAPEVRRQVCAGLEHLGLDLDVDRNEATVGVEATISAAGSEVRVEVLPVDEAAVIAHDTAALLAGGTRP